MVDPAVVPVLGQCGVDLLGCGLALRSHLAVQRLWCPAPAVLAAPAPFRMSPVVALEHLFRGTLDPVRHAIANHDMNVWVEFASQGGPRHVQRELERLSDARELDPPLQ